MAITPEEVEAYQWAVKTHGDWNYVAVLHIALRRHVANEMRLEFEKEHETEIIINRLGLVPGAENRIFCRECGSKNLDPRHSHTAADWDKAAHEALMED